MPVLLGGSPLAVGWEGCVSPLTVAVWPLVCGVHQVQAPPHQFNMHKCTEALQVCTNTGMSHASAWLSVLVLTSWPDNH